MHISGKHIWSTAAWQFFPFMQENICAVKIRWVLCGVFFGKLQKGREKKKGKKKNMYGKKKKHNKNKYLIQILSFLRVDPFAMMSSTTTEICRVMLLCLLAPISTNLLNQNPTASASQTLGISTFFSKSNFLLSPSSTNHIHIQLSNNSNFPFPTFSIPTLLSPTFQIIAQVSPSHTNSFPCNCTVLYNTYYTFSPLLQFSHNEVWYLLFIPPPIQFLSITTSPPPPTIIS